MQTSSEDDRNVAKADRRRFFAALFAHGNARVLSKLASAPFDRIKICLQVSTLNEQIPKKKLGTIPHALKEIVSSQGPRALWQGSGTHISGITLGAIVRLSLLKRTQLWAMPGGNQQYYGFDAYVRRCAFLYAAGATALVVAYPLDVAYTCLASDTATPRKLQGIVDFMRSARREHGIRCLYRGLPLCLATAFPFIGIATFAHDILANRVLHQMGCPPPVDHRTVPPGGELFWLAKEGAPVHLYPWNLLVGAASGFVAQSITYPLDTLRRNWQISCMTSASCAPQNTIDCARQMWSRGGWRSFYAGYGVNAIKLVPELFVLCGVYLHINSSANFV